MPCSSTLFSLGVFSDVQYADREKEGNCHFRESLKSLKGAIECFNSRNLEAVINLGDLVDSNEPAHLDAVMEVLEGCIHPFIHVLGNHDLLGPVTRREMESRLGIVNSWGEKIKRDNWRIIVVDSTEISVAPDGLRHSQADRTIQKLRQEKDPCAENWNGMAGDAQMVELGRVLDRASLYGHNCLIVNHMVTGDDSGSSRHRCWNHHRLRRVMNSSLSVVAHFNGHDHRGGFATDPKSGIHYLTFPAICDAVDGIGAHGIAHFAKNSITVEGMGRVKSRRLDVIKR